MAPRSDLIANVRDVDTVGARILEGLDPDQFHAVTTPSRLVAVIAGAGSGKTRVLIARMLHRFAVEDADPRHTLALTFTREAAGEMRRRLASSGLRERVEVGTFHSVLLGVLRQHWADRRQPIATVVSDRSRLVRDAMGRESREGIEDLLVEIDWAASRGISADHYLSAARLEGRRMNGTSASKVVEALGRYQNIKTQRGIIDLDDVLSMSLQLWERDHEFAEVMRWRFRHILIDEAQDLNPLQHRLVEHLRRGTDDLFMVGDPAQAVYGFNGADPGLLIEVAERFPGIEIVRLATNHRCTPQVVRAGVHVLTTSDQEPTAIVSSRPDGPHITIRSVTDENDEAEAVVSLIRRCDPDLIRSGQIAVLARTHAQITVLRDHLQRAKIPLMSRVDGPGSPYRPAIEEAGRLGSASRLRAWAHDILEEAEEAKSAEDPAFQVAVCVLDFLRENPMGDGLGLRTWFVTTDPLGHGRQMGVELLTFHASKGREWHTVAVTGVETGLVPHRSASTQTARSEEARLLYVAVTRAKERLWVSWAERRGGYRRQISPLIQSMTGEPDHAVAPPSDLMTHTAEMRERQTSRPSSDPDRDLHRLLMGWRAERARVTGILPEQFCSAAVVRAIARSRPTNADELATCSGVGLLTAQRWLPSLAPILNPTTPESGERPRD